MRFARIFAAFVVISCCVAHADTFTTFDFSAPEIFPGSPTVQGEFTGFFTLDVPYGFATNFYAHFQSFNPALPSFTDTGFDGSATAIIDQDLFEQIYTYCGGYFVVDETALFSGQPALFGYYNASEQADINGGYIVPTPELSSIALLGTGLLGAAGIVKRRSGEFR